MPRKPAVDHKVILDVLKGYNVQDFFQANNAVVPPSEKIWKRIAADFRHMIKPKNVYTMVHLNRHDILTELKRYFHIPVEASTEVSDKENISEDLRRREKPDLPESQVFNVIIPVEVWKKIEPVEKIRKRNDTRLQKRVDLAMPDGWGSNIVDLLWQQFKLPCPYSFEKATVTKNGDIYTTIVGKCNECGANCKGIIRRQPREDEEVILRWEANDTRGIRHESKRPLRGEERRRIGKEIR